VLKTNKSISYANPIPSDQGIIRNKMEGPMRVREVGVERIDDGRTSEGEIVGVD
jgi:hypothetical protein